MLYKVATNCAVSKIMQECAFTYEKIIVVWNTAVGALLRKNEVGWMRLKNIKSEDTIILPVKVCLLLLATSPTKSFLRLLEMEELGYIRTTLRRFTLWQNIAVLS